MYVPDDRDLLIELSGLPAASTGDPMPLALADDRAAVLAYVIHEKPAWLREEAERSVESGELFALIEFSLTLALLFGPPNDEALSGHPLAGRGLEPYSAFEVKDSSWLRSLERMNRVHPRHRAENFAKYRHFIFTFHDSTFECIARAFRASSLRTSSSNLVMQMHRLLGDIR
jgi:hypothetical protein